MVPCPPGIIVPIVLARSFHHIAYPRYYRDILELVEPLLLSLLRHHWFNSDSFVKRSQFVFVLFLRDGFSPKSCLNSKSRPNPLQTSGFLIVSGSPQSINNGVPITGLLLS